METQTSSTLLLEFSGDTFALYLLIICLDHILWTSIDLIKKWLYTKKEARSRRYPPENLIDADYADDLALFATTSTPAESFCIGLHLNEDKTDLMCFKRKGTIFPAGGNKDELMNDVFRWTPTHGCATVGQPRRTYLLHLCGDIGWNLEDLLSTMDDGNGWGERERVCQRNPCCQRGLMMFLCRSMSC